MSTAVATTPKNITSEIRRFCSRIENSEPVFIAVTPHSLAFKRLCKNNVEREIEGKGGEMQLGWIIWEFPKAYLNAEQHVVVRRAGSFIDVTPQFNNESTILFLPSEGEFSGQFARDRYMRLSDHPLVIRTMKLMKQLQSLKAIEQYGPRAIEEEALRLQEEYVAFLETRRGLKKASESPLQSR